MKKSVWIITIMAAASIAGSAGADIIWPSDNTWNALMQGNNFYYDAIGDSNPGAIDLVGTTNTYSAGYWALVEDGYDDGGSTSDAIMRMSLACCPSPRLTHRGSRPNRS